MPNIITLTTDFGLRDPFVGIMKGVILGIAPEVDVVDITHDIHSYDVLEAAFIIETAYHYFPAGTIHVIVVDPGVGSARRPLAAAAQNHIFVAPDNGVLSSVLQSETTAEPPRAYWIENQSFFLKAVSQTFHGRDIFAPVAAHLALGTPIESVGPRIADFVSKPLLKPERQGQKLIGTVLRIDKFGNLITNFKKSHLGADFVIRVAGFTISRLYANFSEAEPGEFFVLEGSTGYIELALNQGSAADRLNVTPGAEIELETPSLN